MTRSPHRRRVRHIVNTAARHGLGYLVGGSRLGRVVRRVGRWLGASPGSPDLTGPEHVRIALEELGTTFVKLGQILSTRGDLIPPAYQVELARLQDSAPPEPSAAILETLTTELGRDPRAVFATFELAPIAAASIGQAHAATLIDGSEVIVKVRRPGVVAAVQEDLEILAEIAARAERRSKLARRNALAALTSEFSSTLRAELDYVQEAHNAERFATNFADDETVHIPRVHWQATTSQILTLERMRGTKISDSAALDALGLDRGALARRAATTTLRMVFEHGFFHADPHPGNFFIEPDGTVGLIDFGMVGSLDDEVRRKLSELLVAFVTSDGDALVDGVLALGAVTGPVDRARLRHDLLQLTADQLGRPLGDVSFGSLLGQTLGVVRRHHLVLPTDLALLAKTIAMCEGVGAQIDPSFKLASVLVPFLTQLAPGAPKP